MQNNPTVDSGNADYNYGSLTATELMRVWRSNRNSMVSVLAANELLRRVDIGKVVIREKTHAEWRAER